MGWDVWEAEDNNNRWHYYTCAQTNNNVHEKKHSVYICVMIYIVCSLE